MFLSGLYVWKQVKKASAPWSERNVPEFFILILIFLIPLSIRLSKLRDNARENSVRPLALGRKNHLFCGNHDAAETPPSSIPLWGAVNWHRSMSASGWATSSPTYTNTTMTTHATWWNCFRTISSRRASCDILWRFSKIPDLFQESWRTLQDFENISNILEGTLQYGVYWWLTKNWYQQITNGKC